MLAHSRFHGGIAGHFLQGKMDISRAPRGSKFQSAFVVPLPRHVNLPIAHTFGRPARARTAPILASEDYRILVRRAQMNSGRSITSRSADVPKPRLVPLAQAFDYIRMPAG